MGFHVSTLHSLPIGSIKHFVHVLDMTHGPHGRWIAKNLQLLASDFGPSAGLVTGNKNLTQELCQFLQKNVTDDFGAVERILYSATCLVISYGHLSTTNKPVYLLPLALPQETEAAEELIGALLRMLSASIKEDRIGEFVSSLGAIELGLTRPSISFIVCTLREVNKMLELKPNVAGMGVNLNAIIEKLLPADSRMV